MVITNLPKQAYTLKKRNSMKHLLPIILIALSTSSATAKRPPKPPKEPKTPLTSEQKQAIVAGAAQVMGGVMTIVQDPHNKHNVGSSVANMLHGLINILVEKIGNRTIDLNDNDAVEECINELCKEVGEEFAEIMRAKKT
jgi:hypothetical protein